MADLKVVKKEQDEDDTLFFGGLPTNIELTKLREKYPESQMEAGQFIPYPDIETLLSLDWRRRELS